MATEDPELDPLMRRALDELAAHEPARTAASPERARHIVQRVRRQLMVRDVLTFMTARLVAAVLAVAGVLYARFQQRSARRTAVGGGERPD